MTTNTKTVLQQCRTMFILRTICLVVNAIILVKTLQEDLFTILKGDAVTMERWDPTDIIATPFPIKNLQLVASKACRSIMLPNEFILTVILMLYQGRISIRNLTRESMNRMIKFSLNYMLMMIMLNAFVIFVAIGCGASPDHNMKHTVLATIYLTTLAFGYIQPSVDEPFRVTLHRVIMAPDYNDHGRDREHERERELSYKDHLVNELNCCMLYSTFLVTIPFMILNILDHGDQNQRWPVPIILGSLCGHLIGIFIGSIVGFYRLHRLAQRTVSLTAPSPRSVYVSPPKFRSS